MSLKARIAALESKAQSLGETEDWDRYVIAVQEAMRQSVGGEPAFLPTPRWKTLRVHPVQALLWNDKKRFKAVPAGRRSGKTEIAKRRIVLEAISHPGWYVASAPTHGQARRIYWQDLKQMVPSYFVHEISESGKIILTNGSEIQCIGLDAPERIEGRPLKGIILDEYANMLDRVWPYHVRPALADSLGWAWCIGVPEGRNHYYEMCERAKTDEDWGLYHWWSEDILPKSEIDALAKELDEATFNQELRASFEVFRGRVYYAFARERNCYPVKYDPKKDLIFCFDFNVEPGICVIVQEQDNKIPSRPDVADSRTCVIGEVYIPRDSNTPTVCRKLIADWSHHKGGVQLFGDPAGGARSTKTENGSDWQIIWEYLKPVFGDRLRSMVKRSAPRERVRLNTVNARIRSKSGTVHLLVNPLTAPKMVEDFDAVCVKEGTDGEVDKSNPKLTHLSDAIGYYIESRFPLSTNPNPSEAITV